MSIALLATDTTVICRVVKALYDAAPGYTYLSNFTSYKNSYGLDATVNALASAYSSQTNAELAATVCTNLGLTGTAYTAGVDYLTGQFNATTAANRGVVIKDAMNGLANLTGDATFGAAADAFNASIARSEAYSTNSDNTSTDLATLQASDDVTATTSFDLTTTVGETVSGTAGNDVFMATDTNTGATLNDGDVINGGAGDDTLMITTQGGGDPTFRTNGVETISLRLLSATTLDAIQWSGVDRIEYTAESSSGIALTLNNVADTDTVIGMNGVIGSAMAVSYLDATSGDTGYLAVSGVVGATSTDVATVTMNTVGEVSLDVDGDNRVRLEGVATDLVVTGTGSGTIYVDGLSGLDASDYTGNLNVTFSGASNVDVVGGTGNDLFTFGTTLNSLDSIDGGEGSDKVKATISNSVNMNGSTGVETLDITGAGTATVTVSDISSLTNIAYHGQANSKTVFAGVADGVTTTVSGDSVTMSELTMRYQDSESQTINLNVSGTTTLTTLGVSGVVADLSINKANVSGGYVTTVGTLAIDEDVDSISITTQGSGNLVVDTGLIASGATSINIEANKSADIRLDGVNASALTSITITANDANVYATGTVFQLNTGVQTITLSASGDSVIEVSEFNSNSDSQVTVSLSVETGAIGAVDDGVDIIGAGSGAAITLNPVTVGVSGELYMSAIDVSRASAEISDLSFTIGASGHADILNINAKTVGDIAFDVSGGATGYIAAISAATVGDISVTGASGEVVIGAIVATGIGSITVDGGASFSAVSISQAVGAAALTVGDITLNGRDSDVAIAGSAAVVGDIAVGGSGNNISIGTSTSGTFGLVSVTGSGDVSIELGAVAGLDGFDASSFGGSGVYLSVSGATVGLDNLTFGAGSGQVSLSDKGASVAFTAGTGVNAVIWNDAAASFAGDDTSVITGFDWGSGTTQDTIRFDVSDVTIGVGTAASLGVSAATVLKYSAGAHASAAAGTDVIVWTSATFDDLDDFISAIEDGGRFEVVADSGSASTTSNVLLVWSDGNGDTHLTLANTTAYGGQGSAIFGGALTTAYDIGLIEGLDITTSTYSGLTYDAKFFGV